MVFITMTKLLDSLYRTVLLSTIILSAEKAEVNIFRHFIFSLQLRFKQYIYGFKNF